MCIDDITDKQAEDIFKMLAKRQFDVLDLEIYGGRLCVYSKDEDVDDIASKFFVIATKPVSSEFANTLIGKDNSTWHMNDFLKAYLQECRKGNSFCLRREWNWKNEEDKPFLSKDTTLESLLIELDLAKLIA